MSRETRVQFFRVLVTLGVVYRTLGLEVSVLDVAKLGFRCGPARWERPETTKPSRK